MHWDDDSIARALEVEAKILPIALADRSVPTDPGFYSIFVDTPESLPAPFDEYLRRKATQLIYIGVASRSLFERLVQQDLRHCHPSSFFRGIGAVLGYRPPIGSLVGLRNQNNYKFSKDDTDAIVTWNRTHL